VQLSDKRINQTVSICQLKIHKPTDERRVSMKIPKPIFASQSLIQKPSKFYNTMVGNELNILDVWKLAESRQRWFCENNFGDIVYSIF